MSTVLTVGTFDLFHSGHVALLKHCRIHAGQDGRVIVGVNSDRFAGTFKKPPIHTLPERVKIVAACRYADVVLVNDASCLEPMLLCVRPQFLVVGMDWAPPRDYMAQIGTTEKWLAENGIGLIFVPRSEGSQSSSAIRRTVIANG